MRLSRWGMSPYETSTDIEIEAEALGALVQVLPSGVDAEIVVVHSKIAFGLAELERTPACRLLLTTTSGTDHIDVAALRSRGILVARLPLVRRDAVVETALMMMLWGLRQIGPLQDAASQGLWARGELAQLGMRNLQGSRVGLVGLGVIGQRMAQVLTALGATVLGCDPCGVPDGVQEASLEVMLGCDVLSLHCDLNPTSQGMIDDAALRLADERLVLVNTARGALVDVPAATKALAGGQLGSLCLDVFSLEPWPHMAKVQALPGLMCLPHAAGFHDGLAKMVREGLVEAVSAFAADRPVPFSVQE